MSYVIDISQPLLALMDELPARTRAEVQRMLGLIVELAEAWSPEDPRWELLAQHDGEGLRFYVDDCCVRVALFPEMRCLMVREIGRVLVHLPADEAGVGLNP